MDRDDNATEIFCFRPPTWWLWRNVKTTYAFFAIAAHLSGSDGRIPCKKVLSFLTWPTVSKTETGKNVDFNVFNNSCLDRSAKLYNTVEMELVKSQEI